MNFLFPDWISKIDNEVHGLGKALRQFFPALKINSLF